jgi:P-type Ca2+ transporter type 2C
VCCFAAPLQAPADARVVSLRSTTFRADEASLTGESRAVGKTPDAVAADATLSGKTDMVFGGTMITGGSALAVVTATGEQPRQGQQRLRRRRGR